jgi:hypothetical protein
MIIYKLFLQLWKQKDAAYANYFQSQWMKSVPPYEWAQCARKTGVPSGDQLLESYNNRLKRTLFPRRNEKLDVVVDLLFFFFQESNYYFSVLDNEALLEEKNS